jgi:hypothetical protein
MFRRFFWTRLLMVKVCDRIAAGWRSKYTYQIQMMGKNVNINKQATFLNHKKKAIKYANQAEKWLDRGTRILDQMKEES